MNFNKILNNSTALSQQIRLILGIIDSNYIEGHQTYNFRCNVCGDSEKSKYKRRGYILTSQEPWMYYCHNCYYKKPVTLWMKEYFPGHFKEYISEVMRLNNRKKEEPKIKNPTIKKKKKISDKEHTKHFIKINDGKSAVFAKAIKLCKERNIPKNVWQKWFVAINGKFKNRLIIPFFDNNGKIYYYQGRSLYDNVTPKYLSRSGKHNSIYNYYNVDKEKPIVVVEGPIDAIFVENAIALTGLKLDNTLLQDFKKLYYWIDYDVTPTTGNKIIQLLTQEKYVFCWKWFIEDYNLPKKNKWDVNSVLLYLNKNNFTFQEIEKYFTNSIYDKVFFI